jgi:hypothetical protein
MTPEQRIRMLIGLDGTPVPDTRPLGPNDYTMPQITPGPEMPLVRAYDAGMMYTGDGEPVSPESQPGDWVEALTFNPPSKREQTAAALQKRRKMAGY